MSTAPRRSLDDIRAAGGLNYAANLIDQGYSLAEVRSRVEARWPDATNRTLDAVVRQGEQAARAGAALSFTVGTTRVLARDVPGPRSAAPNYTYHVLLNLLDEAGNVTSTYPVVLSGQPNLSAGDLYDLAEAVFRGDVRTGAGGPQRYAGTAGLTLGGMEVISVVRM